MTFKLLQLLEDNSSFLEMLCFRICPLTDKLIIKSRIIKAKSPFKVLYLNYLQKN